MLKILFLLFPFIASAQVVEVNPLHSTLKFETLVTKTLVILKEHRTTIGTETYNSIVSGKVRVDEFSDFTFEDYKHFLIEFSELVSTNKLTLEDYSTLQNPNSTALKIIENTIQGFAYGNRIYINVRDHTPLLLASTLVHEVNHVLNQSEKVYYRGPRQAFREEYRAYYVEALFMEQDLWDPRFCRMLKIKVLGLVNDTDELNPDEFPDKPDGKLIPSLINWGYGV
ncbi:MAG: hypothetical protein SGI74_02445 [Oligoflexia bacterium]|nr:hypothetical protein [Oligoflexia bacterium]